MSSTSFPYFQAQEPFSISMPRRCSSVGRASFKCLSLVQLWRRYESRQRHVISLIKPQHKVVGKSQQRHLLQIQKCCLGISGEKLYISTAVNTISTAAAANLILRSVLCVASGVAPGRGGGAGRRVDVALVLAHVEVHPLRFFEFVAHAWTMLLFCCYVHKDLSL